ncbi:hypothetical protein AVEN_178566-1 [Araneus ventricosus]|uniref:Uncharacterized protein n=1 Tax=Araneus ventricosus TaxID=182803 RepID=A0A4Y2FJ45_ARAVE|nr:hypothetical protein AVEN_178566-1 [Araneus ventricosus]
MICPLSNSLRAAAFPITRKSKCKNGYLPSPAAVKYHSHLTTCPPRHPDDFIEKCGDGHNVLASQCIPSLKNPIWKQYAGYFETNLLILKYQRMREATTESAPLSPCFCVTPAGGRLTNDIRFGASQASILSGSSEE